MMKRTDCWNADAVLDARDDLGFECADAAAETDAVDVVGIGVAMNADCAGNAGARWPRVLAQ